MLTTNYTLDMTPGAMPLVIPVSQYDTGSRDMMFTLVDSMGIMSLPNGVNAAIRGTKPDGNGFDNTATISDAVVTVTITEQMTAVAGRVICEIYVYSGTQGGQNYQQLATANFELLVERAALDKDTLVSGSDIRQLVNVIDRTDEIISAAALADSAASSAATSELNAARSAASASASEATAVRNANAASASATAAADSAAQAHDHATNTAHFTELVRAMHDVVVQKEASATARATNAEQNATLAKSYAVGGTGSRTGENTDNAKFYAQVAQQGAEYSGYVFFDVDNETGKLMVTITDSLDAQIAFSVNETTGKLEVTAR